MWTSARGGRPGRGGQRRGFDSLVQLACGIADEGRAAAGDPDGAPRPLPAQVLDHATGFLAALGAIQALRYRQAGGGGSHVSGEPRPYRELARSRSDGCPTVWRCLTLAPTMSRTS